ncbi:DUF3800 domain-containing protein [Nocardia nova]|uniref:DUF3800 domain-containing protein n=1 Tax=Nocardia nova TaxID=37330 RepID=UPI001894E4F5|nr:DUF3800 domain-containing protein [Nocardia nova]MBF6150265.1 DUF3800 domain-containing protein [Nocardia nova]
MLLAYIDEIGETGAFVSRDHNRFNTSPAFGYAGFLIPEAHARSFGGIFTKSKQTVFKTEIEQAEHPGRWERKGASIFRQTTPETFPQQIRAFDGLVRQLKICGGVLFYYVDEKPIGTPKQTELDTDARETAAMRETLNRIARHAHKQDQNVLVMIDQVNEKTRAQRLPAMYSHILGRTSDYPEMARIAEPPMHIDSVLSSNIQFADWVAACITRAVEYQLIRESPYRWVSNTPLLRHTRGRSSFSYESKLHLYQRSIRDINNFEVFNQSRSVHPIPQGQLLGERRDASYFSKIKAAADRSKARQKTILINEPETSASAPPPEVN